MARGVLRGKRVDGLDTVLARRMAEAHGPPPFGQPARVWIVLGVLIGKHGTCVGENQSRTFNVSFDYCFLLRCLSSKSLGQRGKTGRHATYIHARSHHNQCISGQSPRSSTYLSCKLTSFNLPRYGTFFLVRVGRWYWTCPSRMHARKRPPSQLSTYRGGG